jgi:hypothetical protein
LAPEIEVMKWKLYEAQRAGTNRQVQIGPGEAAHVSYRKLKLKAKYHFGRDNLDLWLMQGH